jgi:mannose-6-phosphate isomerase-like protein (cupin superfamily)
MTVKDAEKAVRLLLAEAGMDASVPLELSHHYGMVDFAETGATFVPAAPGEKLIVLLPNQFHPTHRHAQRSERYLVLHGSVEVILDETRVKRHVRNGEFHVPRGTYHGLWSHDGCVIRETFLGNYDPKDTFYADTTIHKNPSRKTQVAKCQPVSV